MSDTYAIPGPWAAGSRQAHQGRENHQKHRGQRRERREAFLAAMSAGKGEPSDTSADSGASAGNPDQSADRSPRRGGGPRGSGPRGRGRGRFGGPPFGGPPFGGGRGRARRGDVRAAILALLAEGPRNGYGVIQEIEERSNGVWKPSPGAIYPALAQLEDEGLVRGVEVEGRKLFELTDAGRTHVTEHVGESKPWDSIAAEAGTDIRDAKQQMGQVWHAFSAVHQDGTPEQIEAAAKVLADARRSLYRILAEDDDSAS